MDEQQRKIVEDLHDIVTGDILVDELSLAAFSTDASILEVRPLAVIAPKTNEELVGIVKYAVEFGLKIHARGAGTGLAGESLGRSLVVDTSRYLNQILDVGEYSARVQPGTRWRDLQRRLAPLGRMFPPDPISGDRCTIGGMIGTDAAGPHSLRYGTTRDYVRRLKILLASGEIIEVGQERMDQPPGKNGTSTAEVLARRVAHTLSRFSDEIRAEQPATLLKPGGYHLRDVIHRQRVDLARLLVGSEGTLAMIVEAELATLPKPPLRGIVLTSFSTLDAAAHAVLETFDFQPSACELIDRRSLSVVRESHRRYRRWIPDSAEGMLLVEFEADNAKALRARLDQVAKKLGGAKRYVLSTNVVETDAELALCWEMRDRATRDIGRSLGKPQPIAFVENTAVPPERLPTFLRHVQDIMKRHGVTATYTAHAGVGILHTRPLLDIHRADHRTLLEALTKEVSEAAIHCRGTSLGEHGAGLLRSGLIPRQFPKLYPAFRRIKTLFDPENLFNPGKIVGAVPDFPILALRNADRSPSAESALPVLNWKGLSAVDMAERCNGCGGCRTGRDEIRMCPSFKIDDSELASPRAKANLMRQILTGRLDPTLLGSDELRSVADLCVSCKMCKVECPSAVDISKLMLEAKAANVAESGLSRRDWFFSNIDRWSRRASANAILANRLLRNRTFRWFAEKMWGLSRTRRLPRFHHQTFLRRAARNGWTKKPPAGTPRKKIAFLADTFVNHNDPHLGECAVRVLEHLGHRVYVPPQQGASGMAPLLAGDLEHARVKLRENLRVLADLTREGFTIISTEPSAIVMLRDDAANLLDDVDVELVRRVSYEFTEYLGILNQAGGLKADLKPIPLTIGYHEPCYQRVLAPPYSARRLLSRIPELSVIDIDLGCSGMAGLHGLRDNTSEDSLRAGKALLDRFARGDSHFGVTQCSACRLQMEQGTGKRTIHPAKWFAVAYGLVTRPERIFRHPKGTLLDE
ncbi:Anaerobic glycerol-3-phosphate dehydrogenase subunit C [Planctomycetes bacterium Pan216]|uniref:Anaerobic glycerol-3-phosphate dehydrogenase subunit C n=1 Tax=Kolteria novifilia TaxID=2527975 RepID=A0A518B517_9BACT|nr:Anaerobic glycerol-3-phosphate dehydrogenase subunit C [Planctomycetes bacterium Pan216]